MATGTFYLRPSADISLGHPVYPDTLTAGYLAINEEVSDGTSTYIGVTSTTTAPLSYTSKFRMSLTEEAKITNVTSAIFCIEHDVNAPSTDAESATECAVYVSGDSMFTAKYYEEYKTDGTHDATFINGELISEDTLTPNSISNIEIPNFTSLINQHIASNGSGSFPEIIIEITNSVTSNDNGTKALSSSYVTQVYIRLECEYQSDIGINHKVNGSWVAATAAYQKVSGAWTEITADECKSILQGNLIGK